MLKDIIENVKILRDVTQITLYNINTANLTCTHIYESFAKTGINLDMISQTPCFGGDITLSFTLSDDQLPLALDGIAALKNNYGKLETTICSGNLTISFWGKNMENTPGIAAAVFRAFSDAGINILLVTTSDISISVLGAKSDEVNVMRMLEENNISI